MWSFFSFLLPKQKGTKPYNPSENDELRNDLLALPSPALATLLYGRAQHETHRQSREEMVNELVLRTFSQLPIPVPSERTRESSSKSAPSPSSPSSALPSSSFSSSGPVAVTPGSFFPSPFSSLWGATLPTGGTRGVAWTQTIIQYLSNLDLDSYQSIAAMRECRAFSPEELRLRDYEIDQRASLTSPNAFFTPPSSPVDSSPTSPLSAPSDPSGGIAAMDLDPSSVEEEQQDEISMQSILATRWFRLGCPEELRVQAYELSGGSPLLSSSPFSLNPSATPFQPFKPLRFLPTASSSYTFPHFPKPAKSSTLRQQPSRKTATLPNRSTARRGTKSHLSPSLPPNESTIAETADPTTSGVPPPSPPPSPLQTKGQSGRVVETDLVLDPTAIPLPQTPPPAFVVPPTSIFTFKNIEVEGSATTTNRDASKTGRLRSREETLVNEDRTGKRERSEGDMRGEELALRMLVKVSETHAAERDKLQTEIDKLRLQLHEHAKLTSAAARAHTKSEISSLSRTLNQSLSSEVIRLKTEFDTQIIMLQNEQEARVNFDFVTELKLTHDIYEHAVRWGVGKSFAKRLHKFWVKRAATFETRQPERIERIEELKSLVKMYAELAGEAEGGGGTERLPPHARSASPEV